MSEYQPHKWVVIQIVTKDNCINKVLGSWSGGYLYGDSWRLNSGIESVSEDGDFYVFHGYSGSDYRCHKEAYGMNAFSSSVLTGWIENAENNEHSITVLDESTNWKELV